MIIDHRTYTAHPGKLNAFLKVYQEQGWPLQQKYLGDCVGWYVGNDIGPLNQVIHMWRYQDLNDRAERRAKLNADPAWQQYLAEATQYLQHMENKILTAAPFFNPNP